MYGKQRIYGGGETMCDIWGKVNYDRLDQDDWGEEVLTKYDPSIMSPLKYSLNGGNQGLLCLSGDVGKGQAPLKIRGRICSLRKNH